MGNFGISLGFPAGFLSERFGARVTAVVAAVVSTLGFLLLWSTTLSKDFYHDHAWLQYIYFFVAGTMRILARLFCNDREKILQNFQLQTYLITKLS